MTQSSDAEQLQAGGRFSEALRSLNAVRAYATPEADLLRAELLERTGDYPQSATLVRRLLADKRLTLQHQGRCEFVLGLIDWGTGDTDDAVLHFQRSVSRAESAGDLQRLCWAQLMLMVVVADRTGASATNQLFAAVRANVTKLGEPSVSAALHLLVGELEAKRGFAQSAKRHTLVGQRLLRGNPNLWLEAIAENNHVAVAIMLSDFFEGIEHAEHAERLSAESGAAAMHKAALGNLGNLYCLVGDFDRAIALFERAGTLLPSTGEFSSGGLESLARTLLLKGEVNGAKKYLNQIEGSIRTPSDRLLYPNRHSQLTAVEVLMEEGSWSLAADAVKDVVSLACRAGDQWLEAMSRLRQVEILSRLGSAGACAELVPGLAIPLAAQPQELHAHYERAFGVALSEMGHRRIGLGHFERSKRVFKGLRNVAGLTELRRAQARAFPNATDHSELARESPSPRAVVQDIAALMIHAGRPELLATGLVAILEDIDSVVGAVAVSRDGHGAEEVLSEFGSAPTGADVRTIALGTARQRTVEVRLQPRTDIESQAALNGVTLLLGTVRDLERARAEREDRLTLWPVDELPADDDDSVVLGQMQRLMASARKVAQTNISVLITGESGTGKEVLARAIHGFSSRAKKPFVPFNCSAIPRDLLESQLFGHRRGAFTGADRDNLGLIRAAKDGTLFLDEVGELSLDLQPKLLRFLESGEINPLGDATPFTVNVRIVAATNANLEQRVEEGRFREDLFYRLNVVRLSILPLRERRDEIPALVHHFVARACTEFAKGRVKVAEETMEHLLLYSWPGNIRQLQNELRRMVAMTEADAVLIPSALSRAIRQETQLAKPGDAGIDFSALGAEKLGPTLSKIEREMIKSALRANHGRLEATARALGISRKGLYLKRQRLGV